MSNEKMTTDKHLWPNNRDDNFDPEENNGVYKESYKDNEKGE